MNQESLKQLQINDNYRSDQNDVVSEFYIPCLSASSRYDRAVGYFTSGSLKLFSRGLDKLVERGGHIRLIASPHLSSDDLEDIEKGYSVRHVISQAALRELDTVDDCGWEQLGYLGQLIATGKLNLKLAFLEKEGKIALYHEKIGIMHDNYGHAICFTGSANETVGGLLANFESLEVYKSWEPADQSRALRMVRNFDAMWINNTKGLEVIEFPEVSERIVSISEQKIGNAPKPSTQHSTPIAVSASPKNQLSIPQSLRLRDYQQQAIKSWFNGGLKGIFKMATGTGKTKTALAAASKLSGMMAVRGNPLVIVIVAPYLHLADQWLEELKYFGSKGIACFGSAHTWRNQAMAAIDEILLGIPKTSIFVVSNDTLTGNTFQELLRRIKCPLMLIGDEAHNLGANHIVNSLPLNATYRLGLSATPERWMDAEGTAKLLEYFGNIVFEMNMQEAIESKSLCQYEYKPRLVSLDAHEMELYAQLTAKIGALMSSKVDLKNDDGPLGQLLRKRGQILGHATAKIGYLTKDLLHERDSWYQLVYCAEGQHPQSIGSQAEKQLEQVLRLVGKELGLTCHDYKAETTRTERRRLLERFSTGDDLKVLVSMKCLDEGVDIPDARVAYLVASSSNPRQFIQRRGRILRNAPGKTFARIYDYLAVPQDLDEKHFDIERKLVEREIARATEFANLATNYGEALELLRPLKEHYQLMDY